MYKVMIVEDEPPILRNLESKINEVSGLFEIAFKAFDAETAYKKLKEIRPDIVISDIRMPGKGGLWLLRQIRTFYPNIICVALSGYKDFEYVSECLRLKIEDYLLKPVSVENLKMKFDEIAKKLKEREYKDIHDKLHEMIIYSRRDKNFPDSIRKYNCFRIIIVYKGSLDFRVNKGGFIKQDNFINDFKKIREYLNKSEYRDFWLIERDDFNGIYIIFGETGYGYDYVYYHDLAKNICDICEEQVSTTVVISKKVESPELLYDEYKSAKLLLTNSVIIGKSQILRNNVKGLLNRPSDNFTFKRFNSMFASNITSNDSNSFKLKLEALFEQFVENNLPQIEVQKAIKQIIKLCQFVERNGDCFAASLLEDEIDLIFFEASDMQDIFKCIWYLVKEDLFHRQDNQTNRNTDIVDEIEKYLKNNYMNHISLNSLSDIFGYESTYLSRLFKKYKSISPINYLISIRIQEAKRIIEESPQFFFKDIAQRVGYEDQHYFYKLFKACTGQTLSQYKNSLL